MKCFLDRQDSVWNYGKTINKVISGMTSAQNPNGGKEATLLSLYTAMMHWGAIITAPGYTDHSIFTSGGNPYGVSVSVDQKDEMIEDVRLAVQHHTERTLKIAKKIKNN